MPIDEEDKVVQEGTVQETTTKSEVATEEEDKSDWFFGKLSGMLPTNNADLVNEMPDTQFKLKKQDEYWENPKVQKMFVEAYGEEDAESKFFAHYKNLEKDYSDYSQLKFIGTSQTPSTSLFSRVKPLRIDEKEMNATNSRAKRIGDIWTEQVLDTRKGILDADRYVGLDGSEYDVSGNDLMGYISDNLGGMVNFMNPMFDTQGETNLKINGVTAKDFKNEDGKEFLGMYYNPEALDPYGRSGEQEVIIAFKGDYAKVAGLEQVTDANLYGVTDPSLTSTATTKITALPKGIYSSVASIGAGVYALEAAAIGIVDPEDGTWLNSIKEEVEAREVSLSATMPGMSKEAESSMWNMEHGLFLVGEVGAQVLSGTGTARIAESMAVKYFAAKTTAKISSIASKAVMSLSAGADMRKNALANGFSEREASALYFANLFAMYQAQKLAGYIDKGLSSSKLLQVNREGIKNSLLYFPKEVVTAADKALSDKATKGFIKTQTNKLASFLVKGRATNGKALSEVWGGFREEGLEEATEFLSEESIKQLGNAYVGMGWAGREYGEAGEGRFKDIYDDGYWSEFAEGLAMSAGMGAVTGAAINTSIGKKIFFGGVTPPDYKNHVVSAIMSGKGKEYIAQAHEMHAKEELGSVDSSIDFDKKGEYYKPYRKGSKGKEGMNHNDANLQVLLQEFNYIKATLEGLNIKGGVDKMLKENPTLLDNINNTTIIKDSRQLIQDYFAILETNDDLAIEQIEPPTEDITPDGRVKYIQQTATEKGISVEEATTVIEMKENLRDLHNGQGAIKYYMQNMVSGTVLDPAHPDYDKNYGKHGKDLMENLMKLTTSELAEEEKSSITLKETIKKNTDTLNKLNDDLSNSVEVIEELKENGIIMSDADRLKLEELVNNNELSPELVEKVRSEFKARIEEEGIYNLKTIKSTPLVKKLYEDNPELTDQLDKFLPLFLKTFTENELDSTVKTNKFQEYKLPSADSLIRNLNDEEGLQALTMNNVLGKMKGLSSDEVVSLSEALASTLNTLDEGSQAGFKASISGELAIGKIENLSPTLTESVISLNNVKLLKDHVESQPDESALEFNSSSLHNLLKGFKGDDLEVESTDDFEGLVKALQAQAKNSILSSGKSTFKNVTEVQETLNQVRARQAQATTLSAIATGMAELRSRQKRLDTLEQSDIKERFNDDTTIDELLENSKYLNKTLINPLLFSKLMVKVNPDGKSLEGKSVDEIISSLTDDEKEGFKQLNSVQNSNNAVNEILGQYEKVLSELLKLAKSNEGSVSAETVHTESLSKVTKGNVEAVMNLIIKGEIDNSIPEVAAFSKYYHTVYKTTDVTPEHLSEDFKELQKIKAFLYSIDEDLKPAILDKFKAVTQTGNLELNNILIVRATMSLNFDENLFYSHFKGMLEAGKLEFMPTADQQEVAMMVAANINTNLSSHISNGEFSGVDNMAFVDGAGGAGKSTAVLGVGVKIGQEMIKGSNPGIKPKVILASNNDNQITIIDETAKKFGIESKVVGGNKGLVLEDLLYTLENNKGIDDVTHIVYDEATYIPYRRSDSKHTKPSTLSELVRINKAIDVINVDRRGKGLPELRITLMGDSKQNGYVSKGKKQENIGPFEVPMVKLDRLVDTHRTNVSALSSAFEQVTGNDFYSNREMSNLKLNTQWGNIQGRTDGLLGGVAMMDIYNDVDLLQNIEKQIERYESIGKVFKVAVVTSADSIHKSKLSDMMGKYPDNFQKFTHTGKVDGVQGQEVDYVLTEFSDEDLNLDNNASVQERNTNKKLVYTTISRARYFVAVTTNNQQFNSEEVDTITLPEEADLSDITDKFTALTIGMIESQSVAPTTSETTEYNEETTEEVVAEEEEEVTTEGDTNKESNTQQENIESIKNTLEEEPTTKAEAQKEADDAVESKDTKAIKAANDKLAILNNESKSSSKAGDLSGEEEVEVEDVITAVGSTKTGDSESVKVLEELEDNGVLIAYTHVVDRRQETPYDSDVHRLSFLTEENNIPDEDTTRDLKLQALGYSNSGSPSDFTFTVAVIKDGEFTQLMLVATENSTGNKVNLGSLPTSIYKGKGRNGGSLLPIADQVLTEANMNRSAEDKNSRKFVTGIELPVHNRQALIESISSGNIVTGPTITVKELRNSPDFKGVTFSKRIFVTTSKNSHRGESFIFFTYNEADHDLSDTDALLETIPPFYSSSDGDKHPRTGFKNGIGYIRLDAKKRTLNELYSMINGSFTKAARSLLNMVHKNKDNMRTISALASIHDILNNNRKTLFDRENTESSADVKYITSQEEYKQYDGDIDVFNILKGLKGSEQAVLGKIELILSKMFDPSNMGKQAYDSSTGKIRVGTLTTTGVAVKYPQASFVDGVTTQPITFLNKSSISEQEGEDITDYGNFNLIEFFKTLENETESVAELDRVLKVFNELFSKAKNGGIYLRPQITKKTPTNKVYDTIDSMLDLEESFTTNVSGIKSPSVYLNIDEIKRVLSGDTTPVEVSTVEPISEEFNIETSPHTKTIFDAITNIETASDFKLEVDYLLGDIDTLQELALDEDLSSMDRHNINNSISVLKEMVAVAEDNHGSKPKESDTTTTDLSNASSKVEADLFTNSQDVSDELKDMSVLLIARVNDLEKRIPFIFSAVELKALEVDLKELNDSVDKVIAASVDSGSKELYNFDELIKSYQDVIDSLKNQVGKPSSEIRSRIKDVMEMTIAPENLPGGDVKLDPTNDIVAEISAIEQAQPTSEVSLTIIDAKTATLEELLIRYHEQKNSTEMTTSRIQDEIHNRYFRTGSTSNDIVDEMTSSPIGSIEEFTTAMKRIEAMYRGKEITKTKLTNAKVKLKAKVKDIKNINRVIKALEEDRDIDAELLATITNGDIKTLLEDSLDSNMEESLEEGLSAKAQDIFDNAWSGVENFVSLEVDSKIAQENLSEQLETEITKAQKHLDFYSRFLTDYKNTDLNTKFKELVKEARQAVDQEVKDYNKVDLEQDMTVASKDNLVPYFIDTDLHVDINSKLITDLAPGLQAKWISILNGTDIDNHTMNLFDIQNSLLETSTEEEYKSITEYIKNKDKDNNNCL